jgi:hypothetical protein
MLTFSDSAILVAVFFSTGAALGGSKKGHFANHPQYGAGASGSPGCVSISPVFSSSSGFWFFPTFM